MCGGAGRSAGSVMVHLLHTGTTTAAETGGAMTGLDAV